MISKDTERQGNLVRRFGLPAAGALLTVAVVVGSAVTWAHIGSKPAVQAAAQAGQAMPAETVPGSVKYKDTAVRLEPIDDKGRAQVQVDETKALAAARKRAPSPENLVAPDPSYVLAYYNNDAVRHIEKDGTQTLLEQNIPAWVYTYRLKEYFHLGGTFNADSSDSPAAKPHYTNCRWIVVLSAASGEELFSFENCDEVNGT